MLCELQCILFEYFSFGVVRMKMIMVVLQRVPKLQSQDQSTWWDMMCKMQNLLRTAAKALFDGGKMSADHMHNYMMSGKCKLDDIKMLALLGNFFFVFFI